MDCRRRLLSANVLAKLSQLTLNPKQASWTRRHISSCLINIPVCTSKSVTCLDALHSFTKTRFLSDKSVDKKDDQRTVSDGGESKRDATSKPSLPSLEEDFFGVNYDDGNEHGKIGPEEDLPPKYKRDVATGRLTGEIEVELTEGEKRLIKADPLERDRILMRRLSSHWEKSGSDDTVGGLPKELDELGERVRGTNAALNVFGRSVKAQASDGEADDERESGHEKDRHTQRLTRGEFESFESYMKTAHQVDINEHDIPVQKTSGPKTISSEDDDNDPDDMNRSLKWMTRRAQREMADDLDDSPYADLMPADLSPRRLVNRKQAKLLPVRELSHLNIPLLKSFMSPTGQILSRVQTRLGARDQRRVKKLIKRARCLGLIPYYGQFKAERHGWKHAKDIDEEREWEKELTRRGLVVERPLTGKEAGEE